MQRITQLMKAILCTEFGPPGQLQYTDVSEPSPGAGEAVVAIKAVGLNFFDILIVEGRYQHKPPFPFSPGAEFAGHVEAVGKGVTRVVPGDRVVGWTGHGAAREKIALNAEDLVKLPDALDFDRAAALTVTYGTSYYALHDRSDMQRGETLAVLGAAGGVGIAAVELGHIMGARVIACASSDEKLEFARAHGADMVLNYAREPLKDGLRRLTDGHGVDVVYDPVGGDYSEAALRAIAWGGRLLVVGFAAGGIPKLPLNLALLKSADIRGVSWGAWSRRQPESNRKNMKQLVHWAAEGKLSAHVHAVLPLADAARALEAIGNRSVMGKVVLHP
jgi:NADPH2:quinone reductase